MDVIDFLKKKKEILARTQAEMKDRLSPGLFDYWADVSQTMTDRIQQTRQDVSSQLHMFFKEPSNSNSQSRLFLAYKEPTEAEILKAKLAWELGKENFVGEWLEISQNRIDEFANVTMDRQWIHTDPVRSEADSPFKGTVAHGFLTMSLIPYLTNTVNETQPVYPTARMCINYGMDKVRFQYPVKVGAKVRARSKLVRITSIKQGLEVVREVKVEIENVRRPAVILESIVRVYF